MITQGLNNPSIRQYVTGNLNIWHQINIKNKGKYRIEVYNEDYKLLSVYFKNTPKDTADFVEYQKKKERKTWIFKVDAKGKATKIKDKTIIH